MQENNRFLYTKAVWYLVIATVTMLLINIFSIARYSSVTQSSMNISIANPIIELETNFTELNNFETNMPEISFSVNNFKYDDSNNLINSDVAFYYRIKFEMLDESIPLLCELYRIEGDTRVQVGISDDYISDRLFMPHTNKTTTEYVLCINLDDVNYNNQTDNLKIIIDAEQAI